MRNKIFAVALAVGLLVVSAGGVLALGDESWTGEVIEQGCFLDRGAHGPEHAACAKRCFSRGAEVGLLMADGTLLTLRADPENDAPFEALKELAGGNAKVAGTLTEEDGHKVVIVKASETVN